MYAIRSYYGQYSAKEAAIIATGFSTVSATFMVIVAKTLGLMEIWNLFFWSTLVLTFVVTAITVRFRPLSRLDDTKPVADETNSDLPRLKQAVNEGLQIADQSEPVIGSSYNFV